MRVIHLACFLCVWMASACATRAAEFYVDSHGWHSGIVVPRAAIPPGAWPPGVVERDFAGCAYLELGWGDRKFYPAKHPNAWMVFDAALLPGPSVLHIVGLEPPLADAHVWSALVTVTCPPEELVALCRDLGRSFETDAQGRAARMGPGLYGKRSGFYPARGAYWIGNTCNNWTARELRAGGLFAGSDVFRAFTSGQVIGQARRLVARRPLDTAATPPESPTAAAPAKKSPNFGGKFRPRSCGSS